MIIDEEDELLVSSDRDAFKRDIENGRKVKRGVTEYEMFKKKRNKLNNLPIRFAASFIFSSSATFFSMIYNEIILGKSPRDYISNVMVKSIPKNYHGFSALCNDIIGIIDISPAEALNETNHLDQLDFLDDINKKCLHLFLKKYLVERYQDSSLKQISLLISLGAIWINDNQDRLSRAILEEIDCSIPTICFSYNQKKEIKLITNQIYLEEDTVKDLVVKKFSLYEITKQLLGRDICELTLKSNKKILLKHYYDLMQDICSRFKKKPCIICCAGRLSIRCLTFKGSNMDYPLTDQYYSPTISSEGIISESFCLDAKQAFSRIAGVDNQTFTRYLWVPDIIYQHVLNSINLYDNLKDLHSKNPNESWKEVLKNYLNENHKTLYKCIVKNASITKKSIMNTLQPALIDNVKELDIFEEDDSNKKDSIDDNDSDIYIDNDNDNDNDNDIDDDDDDDSVQNDDDDDDNDIFEEKNLEFLKAKLKNKSMNFDQLFAFLIERNLFKDGADKKNKKKCFIYHIDNNRSDIESKKKALVDALKKFTELHRPNDMYCYEED